MCFFARNSALAKIFGLAKILVKFQKKSKKFKKIEISGIAKFRSLSEIFFAMPHYFDLQFCFAHNFFIRTPF